jgi:hypothetical protein
MRQYRPRESWPLVFASLTGVSIMSVSYENHGRPAERESAMPDRPSLGRPRASRFFSRFSRFPRDPDDQDRAGGFAYERMEGLVQLVLACTLVAGAALILSATVFAPPQTVGAVAAGQAQPAPAVESAPSAVVAPNQLAQAKPAAPKEIVESQIVERQIVERPSEAPRAPEAPATNPAVAPPSQATKAPEPLAPPSVDIREKLAGGPENAPRQMAVADESSPAAPEPEPKVAASSEQPSAGVEKSVAAPHDAADGRAAKCFFKLSGAVQNSGPCKILHTGNGVTFQFPGKSLTITQLQGRVWTATLGGHSLGKVYKSGACWGAKGFYACEKG